MNTKEVGDKGQKIAEDFLINRRYKLISQNYRWRGGEIDIICFCPWKDELVFVEVKTRTNETFGEAGELISYYKKKKILKTAMHFFSNTEISFTGWKVDLIVVKLSQSYKPEKLIHYKNIF